MMKQGLTYLFHIVVFVLLLGAANSYVSSHSSAEISATVQTTEAAGIYEKNDLDHILSLRSEDMILPSTYNLQSVFNQRRIQPTTSLVLYSAGKYIQHQASKDFKDDQWHFIAEHSEIEPFFDPSLEYVFMLRRILA